jgi:adenylylsulfate reductase subunit A
MGYVRNEKGMATALERLHFIEGYLDRLQASEFHSLMRANEAVHLLKTCQLATRATMERKESGRAIYRRSDYPELNEEYARVLAIWQEDGQPQLAWL